MSFSGTYLVVLSQKFNALTSLTSCIVAASLKQVILFCWLIYTHVLGQILTFLHALQPALRIFLQLPHGMSFSGTYLVVFSQKFTALTCLASCIVAASLNHVTQNCRLKLVPVLGLISTVFDVLYPATCLAIFLSTSAWDELLRNIFSGALSKIHSSNLLGKLHCSCIFKTGYSILLV
jgi:hypothetical protein